MNPTINDSPGFRPEGLSVEEDDLQPDRPLTKPERVHRLTRTQASLLGGHSVCDPPDPISNSAVKPDSANGTNAQALEE